MTKNYFRSSTFNVTFSTKRYFLAFSPNGFYAFRICLFHYFLSHVSLALDRCSLSRLLLEYRKHEFREICLTDLCTWKNVWWWTLGRRFGIHQCLGDVFLVRELRVRHLLWKLVNTCLRFRVKERRGKFMNFRLSLALQPLARLPFEKIATEFTASGLVIWLVCMFFITTWCSTIHHKNLTSLLHLLS